MRVTAAHNALQIQLSAGVLRSGMRPLIRFWKNIRAVGYIFFGVYCREGTCFWKHVNATASYSNGVVTVWPPGNGPIPPNPPIWVAVEAHGPYQHGGGFPAGE